MKRRITQGVAAFAALGALALGGSAIAGAVSPSNSNNSKPAPVVKTTAPSKAPEKASGPDTDSVQSGDQSAPDTGNETPGSESSSETGSEQAGSEVAGNDGPGGHADEPANANADHQAQGQE